MAQDSHDHVSIQDVDATITGSDRPSASESSPLPLPDAPLQPSEPDPPLVDPSDLPLTQLSSTQILGVPPPDIEPNSGQSSTRVDSARSSSRDPSPHHLADRSLPRRDDEAERAETKELRANVRRLVEQNDILLAALHNTASHVGHIPQEVRFHQREERRAQYERQWAEDIGRLKVNDPTCPFHKSFRFTRKRAKGSQNTPSGLSPVVENRIADEEEEDPKRSWQDMLSSRQPWNSVAYRAAYPALSNFLENAEGESSRSEVEYFDFQEGETPVKEWLSTGEPPQHTQKPLQGQNPPAPDDIGSEQDQNASTQDHNGPADVKRNRQRRHHV
jgi:hypothetical protein